jgi:uncharacterized membrane protein YebE (DUF533 family)
VLKEGRGQSAPSEDELEDLLGVGKSGQPQRAPQQAPPSNSRGNAPTGDIFGQQPPAAPPKLSQAEQEQLEVIIRAMIFAGKADGRIDAKEQQAIVDKIGNTNPETIQFLRKEFASTATVRDFAWSVPLGMEPAVYAASLSTIEIDTQAEVDYLKELAHGLRLPPKIVNQIHQQYGVRPLYQ